MTLWQQVATVALAVVATMLTRFTPFMLFRPGKPTPRYIVYLGKVLPASVFALLVVYCLRNVHFSEQPYGLPELMGIAVTIAVHVWRRSMLLSIAAGTLCYMFIVQQLV